MKKKIGIFGGTFNPPHVGHLIVADHVCSILSLDQIIFIPSYISPHKQKGEEVLANHRLAMTRLAAADHPCFSVSDVEVKNEHPSYTVDTIKKIKEGYKHDALFLLIGVDNYADFQSWKEPETILKETVLVVMTRPGYPDTQNHLLDSKDRVIRLQTPQIEISSTEIRNRVRKGREITWFTGENVAKYIAQNQLYR